MSHCRRIRTADIDLWHRHEWLREVVGREYADVDITLPSRAELFNEMTLTPWRDLQLSIIRSNALVLERPAREPRQPGQDAYFAVLLLDGDYRLSQNGREVRLRPGDLALYDATRPYRIDCPRPFKKLIVAIPRAVLQDRLTGAEYCTALSIDGQNGIGAVASEFIRVCAREANSVTARERCGEGVERSYQPRIERLIKRV